MSVDAPETGRRRGRLWVFALGFVLLAAAALLAGWGAYRSDLRLTWASIVVSGLAFLMALISVLLPGRSSEPIDRGRQSDPDPTPQDEPVT